MDHVDVEQVAARELRAEMAGKDSRIDRSAAVLDILARRAIRELPDVREARWPRAESQRSKRPVEIRSPLEPHLRIEVLSHGKEFSLRAVPVQTVVQARLIALIVAGDSRGGCLCPIGADGQCLREEKRTIRAVRDVRSPA